MTTRRQILRAAGYTGLAALATPLAAITRCYAPKDQKPAKRIGTFEESARATIDWLKGKEMRPDALSEIEIFKNGLKFELDVDIYSALERLEERVRKSSGTFEGFGERLEKKGHNLEIRLGMKSLSFIFGKITARGRIGSYEVYLIEESYGILPAMVGQSIGGEHRVYLFDDRIAMYSQITEAIFFDKMKEMGFNLDERRRELRTTLSAKSVGWSEIEHLSENMAQLYGVPKEIAELAIVAIRLFYLDERKGMDKDASKKQMRRQVLIHELAHQELEKTMGRAWCSQHPAIQEGFAMLVELAYGTRQYDRLHSIIRAYLGYTRGERKINEEHFAVFKVLVEYIRRHPKMGLEEIMTGQKTEEELREVWLSVLEEFGRKQIGKPFEEIFETTLIHGTDRFIDSIRKL